MKRSTIQMPSGTRTLLFIVLFLTLMTTSAAGVSICSGHSSRPKLLGWVILVGSGMIAVATVDAWARILPGIFAFATVNGVLLLATGRALNQPLEFVPRWESALLTVLMAGASATTLHASRRMTTALDRVAYIGVLCCFVAVLACIMTPIGNWAVPAGIGFFVFVAMLWLSPILGSSRSECRSKALNQTVAE